MCITKVLCGLVNTLLRHVQSLLDLYYVTKNFDLNPKCSSRLYERNTAKAECCLFNISFFSHLSGYFFIGMFVNNHSLIKKMQ